MADMALKNFLMRFLPTIHSAAGLLFFYRRMFSHSSQLKYWSFSGTTEIKQLRTEAYKKYVDGRSDVQEQFLSQDEETKLRLHYEYVLHDFCTKFQPPMPKYVLGTAMQFFKRFYVHASLMDYHPKHIYLVCVYLACKTEEFNVSILQFVANLKGDRERLADVILSQELLLMQHLHYHLVVHNPYRPLEGLLIDAKTRFCSKDEAEKLRREAEDFLEKSLHSDVCLIFAPSQIALAALLSSASKVGIDLDSYVSKTLLGSAGKEELTKVVEHIKRIRYMVKHLPQLERAEVKQIEQRLEYCLNQENNPESEEYQARLAEFLEDDEERQTRKRRKIAEEERQRQSELLGI